MHEIVVSYWPSKKWFWVQEKELQPIEPGNSPEDGRHYIYKILWDGRDPEWIKKRREHKGRRLPLTGLKTTSWEADIEEGDNLVDLAKECIILSIFEETEELGL